MPIVDKPIRVSLNHILFATDFSEASKAALPFVDAIAQDFGSKIFLAHVLTPAAYAYVPPAAWNALAEEDEKGAKAQLDSLGATLTGTRHESVVCRGEVPGSLRKAIKEFDIDLIVMGTHGRTGVGKLLLGSVAEEVFREAPCPVLTVGPEVRVDRRHGVRMSEILFATDLTPVSEKAAQYALALALENEAGLSLLHVLPKPGRAELVHPEQYIDSTLRLLRALVPPETEVWCKTDVFVKIGEPAEQILKLAEELHANLIVLGVRHGEAVPGAASHLPMATAHKIVARAKCPVLTVRGV